MAVKPEVLPCVVNLLALNIVDAVVLARSPDFLSEIAENPTWLDVAVIANESIQETQDRERTVLQDVVDTGRVRGDGVAIYELLMSEYVGRYRNP